MELPMLDFLREQNPYTGNEGDFRYKLQPEGETLRVWAYQTWCLEYCREHGLMLGEAEFPLDAGGLEQAAGWLGERAREMN